MPIKHDTSFIFSDQSKVQTEWWTQCLLIALYLCIGSDCLLWHSPYAHLNSAVSISFFHVNYLHWDSLIVTLNPWLSVNSYRKRPLGLWTCMLPRDTAVSISMINLSSFSDSVLSLFTTLLLLLYGFLRSALNSTKRNDLTDLHVMNDPDTKLTELICKTVL